MEEFESVFEEEREKEDGLKDKIKKQFFSNLMCPFHILPQCPPPL
jgi:hypothetical protein